MRWLTRITSRLRRWLENLNPPEEHEPERHEMKCETPKPTRRWIRQPGETR